jgi:hypothetical protein
MRRAAITSALIVAALAFCSPAMEADVARQHVVSPTRMVPPAQPRGIVSAHASLRAPIAGRATYRQLRGITRVDAHPFTAEFFFADRPQTKLVPQARLARD